jgi:hypothetical protein
MRVGGKNTGHHCATTKQPHDNGPEHAVVPTTVDAGKKVLPAGQGVKGLV